MFCKNVFAEFNACLCSYEIRFISKYHDSQIIPSACPANKFIVIHLRQNTLPCKHLAVFIELLPETRGNSVVTINSIEHRDFLMQKFRNSHGFLADIFFLRIQQVSGISQLIFKIDFYQLKLYQDKK